MDLYEQAQALSLLAQFSVLLAGTAFAPSAATADALQRDLVTVDAASPVTGNFGSVASFNAAAAAANLIPDRGSYNLSHDREGTAAAAALGFAHLFVDHSRLGAADLVGA